MKNKIIIGLAILSTLFIVLLLKSCNLYSILRKNYNIVQSNNKAYLLLLDTVKSLNRVFQFNVNLLKYINDSIVLKLKDVLKELKIKDKNLQSLYYIKSLVNKTDTITIKGDTIFKNSSLKLDTLIGDSWYKLNLKLKYPSTIIASPSFTSEKYLIVSLKKEYVDTPSKLWIVRIFLRKQKVAIVNIVEKNPYIVEKQNRFIQIIK